jgi:hypothetical protein
MEVTFKSASAVALESSEKGALLAYTQIQCSLHMIPIPHQGIVNQTALVLRRESQEDLYACRNKSMANLSYSL